MLTGNSTCGVEIVNKFESKPSSLSLGADTGWAIQVYGRNRRLLCVLDASHGWIFITGCCVGLLLSLIWVNIARDSSSVEPITPTETPALQID